MSKTKAGIINVTGYAGIELARLLHGHPEVELASVTGRSAAGQKLGAVFPHLSQIHLTIEAKLGEVDVAFSAMPHKESAEVILPLVKAGIKIVDISADFRLKCPQPSMACPSYTANKSPQRNSWPTRAVTPPAPSWPWPRRRKRESSSRTSSSTANRAFPGRGGASACFLRGQRGHRRLCSGRTPPFP